MTQSSLLDLQGRFFIQAIVKVRTSDKEAERVIARPIICFKVIRLWFYDVCLSLCLSVRCCLNSDVEYISNQEYTPVTTSTKENKQLIELQQERQRGWKK